MEFWSRMWRQFIDGLSNGFGFMLAVVTVIIFIHWMGGLK